jgi:hypothetical protein
MNLPEKISTQYYHNLVNDKVRMHSSLLLFKGSDFNMGSAGMAKMAKTICALANSGGGDIIYGISVKRGRADSFEPVLSFNRSDDWLLNEIQSQIDKPVKDFKVDTLDFNEQDNSKIIHLSIPSNNDQPHMFSDSRFYKWQKNRVVLLDEAEVRMLYGKLSSCELEFLGIYNTNGLPVLSAGKYSSMTFYPKLLIRNAGNIVEKDYKVEISFPAKLHEESFQPLQALFIRHDGANVVFGSRGNHPLFQQEIATMIEAKITVTKENVDVFMSEYLNVTLYFSNGIKKHSLKLSDTLTYNGKMLHKEDFTVKTILTLEI